MATTTVKKNVFIGLPAREFKEYLEWKVATGKIKTFKPTKADLEAFRQGEIDIKNGNVITLDELKRELASRPGKKTKKGN
jgi:hypothetical protein